MGKILISRRNWIGQWLLSLYFNFKDYPHSWVAVIAVPSHHHSVAFLQKPYRKALFQRRSDREHQECLMKISDGEAKWWRRVISHIINSSIEVYFYFVSMGQNGYFYLFFIVIKWFSNFRQYSIFCEMRWLLDIACTRWLRAKGTRSEIAS